MRGWGKVTCMINAMIAFLAVSHSYASPLTAFVGARILPVTGPEIPNGVIVTRDGKIVAIGAKGSTPIPKDAKIVNCDGKTIMPGIVDTHSHVGGPAGADSSSPIQPDTRAYDSINVRDSGFKRALAGGLTTINIMPGSGHLMSGQTLYVKNRGGKTIDDYVIKDDTGWIMGGMKMANGTNPIRPEPPFSGTRGKSMALDREVYIKAQEYAKKVKDAAGDPKKMPVRDIGMEALGEVLSGKRIVHNHTHRADDILSAIRLSKEFGYKMVLHHVSEGWKVADEIKKAGVPCSIIFIDSPGGKLEAVDLDIKTGAALEKAGVLTAYHTDDGITDSRLLLRSAAMGIRAGLTRQGALESMTISGAKMLRLDGRVGSLELGKDADLVILSGDPFSVYTKVLETWVEGKKVFDRANPKDALYATGGLGASHDSDPYLCCGGGWIMHKDGQE